MPNYRIADGRRYYIDYCPYCGAKNAPARGGHLERCSDCTDRYLRYAKLKKAQPLTDIKALNEVIAEYQELRAKGFRVPKDIP